jgi:hypothetical protein
MPKATVNEHYLFHSGEYEIWSSWKVFAMETEPVA